MLSTSRASSDIRLWSHGGSQTILTLAPLDARHARHRVLDHHAAVPPPTGSSAWSASCRSSPRGRPRCRPCRSGRARRCRPEFPGRRRSSAPRRCRRSCGRSRPRQRRPPCSRRRRRRVCGSVRRHAIAHAKISCALIRAPREAVDLVLGVVEPERGPAGRGDAIARQQRHHAMGAGAHRDAGAVDDGRDVVRMRALHLERDDRRPCPWRVPKMRSELISRSRSWA